MRIKSYLASIFFGLSFLVPALTCSGRPHTNDKIAFSSDRDGNDEIYSMNSDGTGQTRLTNNTVGDTDPVWSPDGRRIVFARGSGVEVDIYVMNRDGTGQTRLTTRPGREYGAQWSPDGIKIIFMQIDEVLHTSSIYVMNNDGSALTRLSPTDPQVSDFSPSWSADGITIAFGCIRSICAMNADGSNRITLAIGGGQGYTTPRWSPDG